MIFNDLIFLMRFSICFFYYLFYFWVYKYWWDFVVVFLVIIVWNVFFFKDSYVWVICVCEVLVYFINFVFGGLNVFNGVFFYELKVVRIYKFIEKNLMRR